MRIASFLVVLPLGTFICGTTGSASAQITYSALGPNNSLQLRQMNGDGGGDTAVAQPFATFEFPVWSREGRYLALTAADPASPNQRGQNVFAIDTATGQIRAITFNNDFSDPITGQAVYTFPYYKAFSPNGSAMAVFSRVKMGGDAGNNTTTPVLEIYPTNGASEPLQVHVDKGSNGKHHGGEGVDWSVAYNLLVAPVQSSAPFQSGGGPGETTALILIEPVVGAVVQGRYSQLTFPRADGSAGQGGQAYLWGEHDYQPRFSPNGHGVAYVRSFQNFFLLSSSTPDPDIQSLRIVNVDTGFDREIIHFNPGFYVTALDWSPDGTQLVFDLGQQLPGPLGPQQQVDPQTVAIYAINVDGSNVRQLRGPGNGTPAWRPIVAAPPVAPRLTSISRRSSNQFLIQGVGTPGLSFQVNATTDLAQQAQTIGKTTVADANGKFQFTDTTNLPRRFYRVVSQ